MSSFVLASFRDGRTINIKSLFSVCYLFCLFVMSYNLVPFRIPLLFSPFLVSLTTKGVRIVLVLKQPVIPFISVRYRLRDVTRLMSNHLCLYSLRCFLFICFTVPRCVPSRCSVFFDSTLDLK